MCLVIIAAIIYMITLIMRALFCEREITLSSPKFLAPLIVCMLANLIAYFGFLSMASGPPNINVDYGSILSVLSLLSAGVIAGNFAFTHQEAAEDEAVIVTILAIFFILLFYLLFAGVCFYAGKSVDIQNATGAAILIPTIVFVILLVNTLFEYWDYRIEKTRSKRRKRGRENSGDTILNYWH
jgi:hypothetical protein